MLPSGFVASTPTFIRALAPMDENRSGSVGLGISTSTRPSLLPRSSTRQSLTNDAPLIEFDVTTTLPSSSDGRATAELERKLRESRRESLELKSKLANEMGMLAKEGERYRGQLAKAEGESEVG